jgi:hypothetical protein
MIAEQARTIIDRLTGYLDAEVSSYDWLRKPSATGLTRRQLMFREIFEKRHRFSGAEKCPIRAL